MRTSLRLAASTLTVALVAGACGTRTHRALPVAPAPVTTTPPTTAPSTTVPPTTVPKLRVTTAGVALTPFSNCDELLAYAKAEASREVTTYGLAWPYPWMGMGGVAPGEMMGAGPMAANAGEAASPSSGPASEAAPVFSPTNDQEIGVDEPDAVKTDGRVLLVLRGTQLQAVDVTGTPRLAGALDLGTQASGLFLIGNEAAVIEPAYSVPGDGRQATKVTIVSVVDPDHLVVLRSFSVDGQEVAARLIGHSIKLVVTSTPRIAFPQSGSYGSTPAAALAANRAAIARTTVEDWLPAVTDATGARRRPVCASVEHAGMPEGLNTVSVVTIDPNQPTSGNAVAVLADAQTVYASADTLYVAAMNMPPVVNGVLSPPAPSALQSVIHAFSITGTQQATYLGSGAVPGTLLNQYSLSEFGGVLRVATTLGIPTPPPGEGGPVPADASSQSFITVVRVSNGTLAPIGQVGGLGRGQKIFAVRFIGALGYVVTFRQLDPLYVVDLSNPFRPAVRGALELSGYSAYLHPLDATHLLGVGGSADANGRRTGLQLTLFDIHDPSQPAKVSQETIANGSSSAEQDPHALLWWAPTSLAVIPVNSYDSQSGSQFSGAIGFRVSATQGITEVGRIAPPTSSQQGSCAPPPSGGAARPCYAQPMWSPIERDVVIGDSVYSLSPNGIVVSDLSTLQRREVLTLS